MKKHIATLCLVIIAFVSFSNLIAQDFTKTSEKYMYPSRQFDNDLMTHFKNTKTVFFYSNYNSNQIDSLKQALSSVWDLTPLIFDDIENAAKYVDNPDYSYFSIETEYLSNHGDPGKLIFHLYGYIALRLFEDASKKCKLSQGLGRIELYPNNKTRALIEDENFSKHHTTVVDLYKRGLFYNWSFILLKAQVGSICTNLKKNLRPAVLDEVLSNNRLKQLLSNDTLYVPERVVSTIVDRSVHGFKVRINFTGMDPEAPREDNVFAGYRHKYRICTDQELYDILQTQKRGRLLFEYARNANLRFITIYDVKEKSVVYKKSYTEGHNLESEDSQGL
jgi:hypothetical protein